MSPAEEVMAIHHDLLRDGVPVRAVAERRPRIVPRRGLAMTQKGHDRVLSGTRDRAAEAMDRLL